MGEGRGSEAPGRLHGGEGLPAATSGSVLGVHEGRALGDVSEALEQPDGVLTVRGDLIHALGHETWSRRNGEVLAGSRAADAGVAAFDLRLAVVGADRGALGGQVDRAA